MRASPDTLFTAGVRWPDAVPTSAYFMAGGALIAATPFFVTGPLAIRPGRSRASPVVALSVSTLRHSDRWPAGGRTATAAAPLLIGGSVAVRDAQCWAHLLVTGSAGLVAALLLLGMAGGPVLRAPA